MSPRPTRRFLLTLAPAAAVAPASAAAHPDAELLAACDRYCAAHAAYAARLEAAGDDDDAWDAAGEASWPELDAAAEAMNAFRATTLAGLTARAITLAECSPALLRGDLDTEEQQIADLLRDLLAIAGTAPA